MRLICDFDALHNHNDVVYRRHGHVILVADGIYSFESLQHIPVCENVRIEAHTQKPVTGSEASDMADTPNMKVDGERLWKCPAEYRAD